MEYFNMYWLFYFTLILMRCGDIEVNPGPSSVSEGEFLRLAQLIPSTNYQNLGTYLGIPDAELYRIIVQHSSNYQDALMSVFKRWRDEQRPDEDIRDLLAEGLEKSGLGGLSKELLAGNIIQKRPDVTHATATTSKASTSTGAEDMSTPPHTLSEEELLMLSKEIGPTYYNRVGVNLHIPFVTLDKIKKDTQDTTDALMTVFTRWRDKQLPDTNIRAHLAKALQKSGLVSLSQKLITNNQFTTSTAEDPLTDYIKKAIESGEALCNRSRIMVIGPAGVGKTSFIRRLTGQSFNPDEPSTKGTEENIVTNNAVSSWKIVSDTHKSAGDVLAESIASIKPRTLQEVSKGEETKDFAESTDDNFAKGYFAERGGELCVEYYGFRLLIPSGALEKEEEIGLRVVTEIKDDIVDQFQDDDIVVSYGFKLSPSGLKFKRPAKLIIPHCAVVIVPNNIQAMLYPLDKSGQNKQTLGLSNMFCSVQDNWIEVFISHFCGGTPVVRWSEDETSIQAILLSCLPFLPITMPPNRNPVLEVRFVKNTTPGRRKLERLHKLDGEQFQAVKDDDDEIVFQQSDLSVSCILGEKSVGEESIAYSTMAKTTKQTIYFPLDMTNVPSETRVILHVEEKPKPKKIIFNTRFRIAEQDERCSSGSDSNPTSVNVQLGAEDAGRVIGNRVIHQQYITYNNGTRTAGVAASRALENTLDESEMSRPQKKKKGKNESPR